MRRKTVRKIASGRKRFRPEIDEAVTIRTSAGLQLDLKNITYLPPVSIVTITKDRADQFQLALRNWKKFRYPEDTIEWIVVDDSKTDELKSLLPEDPRIRYFHLKSVLPIADKRNYAVKKCQGTIIVNMDDDDYHFEDSVLSKVRVLLDNPNKDCVCSLPVGIYDLANCSSVIADSKGDDIPEATLAFRKTFWKTGKFANHPNGIDSEWYGLCNGRWDRMINIPFWFNVIMLTHSKNATGNLRRVGNHNSVPSFEKIWDKETTSIINNIRKIRN